MMTSMFAGKPPRPWKESRNPAAADALAESLNDENAGVRWIAGEALVAIGWEGVRQVLLNLYTEIGFDSTSGRPPTMSCHILRSTGRGTANFSSKPVLERLEGVEPGVSVPLAQHPLALGICAGRTCNNQARSG